MTDYYVGPSGNNTTGLSPATAWTSLTELDTKISNLTVVANDTIYFEGGARSDGEVTTLLSGLSFLGGEAVGFGAGFPLLSNFSGERYSSSNWLAADAKYPLLYEAQGILKTSTATTGLWESDRAQTLYRHLDHVPGKRVTIDNSATARVTWEGHPFLAGDDIFLVDRTGGVVGLDNAHIVSNVTTNTFTVPVDNTTGGVTTGVMFGPRQINAAGMWCWFRGVTMWYRSSTDSSPLVDTNHSLARCNTPNCISYIASSDLNNVTFRGLKFDATSTPITIQATTGAVSNIVIEDNDFYTCGEPTIMLNGTGSVSDIFIRRNKTEDCRMAVVGVRNSVSRIITRLIVEKNDNTYYLRNGSKDTVAIMRGTNTDPEVLYLQSLRDSAIRNNTFHYAAGSVDSGAGATAIIVWHGTGVPASDNVSITGNLIKNFFGGSRGIQFGTGINSLTKDYLITGNKVIMEEGYSIKAGVNFSNATSTPSNIVANNVFYRCDRSIQIDDAGEKGITYYNNISIDPIEYHVYVANTTNTENLFNKNYYYPTVGNVFYNGAAVDYATWSAARNDESITSLQTLDADYRPLASSAMYHAGKAATFLAKDYVGRPFSLTPTIGAYEFTSGDSAQIRTTRT